MSGGVDSTACALMLREKYEVEGFFMALAQPNLQEQKERVQQIASKLDIKLNIIELSDEFKDKVLNYFSSSYFDGLTPNPCVICNKKIKFGLFLDTMISADMDMMATGHYANIAETDGLFRLFCGNDERKDQSYFLSRLNQGQLSRLLFPLGGMDKNTIYDFVESHGFHDFRGLESQDVCFLENNQLGSYLDNQVHTQVAPGNIITREGKILGKHKGLHHYTIGQRKGLGISSTAPLYVIAIDAKRNMIIVGSNEELFRKNLQVKQIRWIAEKAPDLNDQYTIRIRYSHRGSPAKISQLENDRGQIVFTEAQRAVTPGQFAVIYKANELLGSGIIE